MAAGVGPKMWGRVSDWLSVAHPAPIPPSPAPRNLRSPPPSHPGPLHRALHRPLCTCAAWTQTHPNPVYYPLQMRSMDPKMAKTARLIETSMSQVRCARCAHPARRSPPAMSFCALSAGRLGQQPCAPLRPCIHSVVHPSIGSALQGHSSTLSRARFKQHPSPHCSQAHMLAPERSNIWMQLHVMFAVCFPAQQRWHRQTFSSGTKY